MALANWGDQLILGTQNCKRKTKQWLPTEENIQERKYQHCTWGGSSVNSVSIDIIRWTVNVGVTKCSRSYRWVNRRGEVNMLGKTQEEQNKGSGKRGILTLHHRKSKDKCLRLNKIKNWQYKQTFQNRGANSKEIAKRRVLYLESYCLMGEQFKGGKR